MIWVVSAVVGAVFLMILGLGLGRWRAKVLLRGLLVDVDGKPREINVTLPDSVRRYADRTGATGQVKQVILTQSAQIELSPGAGWQNLEAMQWIDPVGAGFVWKAEQRKAGLLYLSVIDAFVRGKGCLVVRLLGAIPVVRALGPEVDHSEAMRFLAELPWAPDAVLSNAELTWEAVAPNLMRVGLNGVRVDLILDNAGDVVEMRALNRPALENGKLVLREWRGLFRDHKTLSGRRIPTWGEVGYVREGVYQPYYRGTVTSYQLVD